jgi:hypothetical protein
MNISSVKFNRDSATIELKARLPLLSVKNKAYFGIFMTKDLNGAETRAPIFSNSKHDFLIKNFDLGKECTLILSFDKKSIHSLDNVDSFCFGLRDFGVRWFPETLVWVKNEFLELQVEEVIPTEITHIYGEAKDEPVDVPKEILDAGETIIVSEILFLEKNKDEVKSEPVVFDLPEESLEPVVEKTEEDQVIFAQNNTIESAQSDDRGSKSIQRRKGKKL